ncbi:MAG: ComF family protein [Chlorobi bacterium]|nr:ComF family protein [Chlorobiota bacterium]
MIYLKVIRVVSKAIIDFVFPYQCQYCKTILAPQEDVWCTKCRLTIQYTNYFNMPLNPVYHMFSAFKDVVFGGSLWFYDKKSLVANILHELKFMRRKELAQPIGEELGEELRDSPYMPEKIDMIIPVPLHPKRLKWRGFNQSEEIAKHVAPIIQAQVVSDVLMRAQETDTQSSKSLSERWSNVSGAFQLVDPEAIRGKTIMLLDDVITTGTTLSHCLRALEHANPKSISVVSVAFAGAKRF